MAKGIGNYIHSRYSTYRKYGINQRSKVVNVNNDIQAAYKAEKQRINYIRQSTQKKTEISIEKMIQVEKLLNDLIYNPTSTAATSDAGRFFIEFVTDQLDKKFDGLVVLGEGLDVKPSVNKFTSQDLTNKSILESKVKQMYNYLNLLIANNKDVKQFNQLLKIKDELEQINCMHLDKAILKFHMC